MKSLLEEGFPFAQLSAVAKADRFNRDGVYAAHKWWARRPPSVIRALLLASTLPAGTDASAFWKLYAADEATLAGVHAGDPFMGGATTLVEAARLGADVTGIDVDPLAVLIAREELAEVGETEGFADAAKQMLTDLRESHGHLFGMGGEVLTPIHYFYLRRVHCRDCEKESLLYRNPVLARDIGKNGGVVRRGGAEVFCPECRIPRRVDEDRENFFCCGRLHRLDHGTYEGGSHTCPHCGARRRHEQLKTGTLPRELIAVEETVRNGHRRIRPPAAFDLELLEEAKRVPGADRTVDLPLGQMDSKRVRRYGFETVGDLFSPRQRATLAAAFDWVDTNKLDTTTAARLRLAVSNALAANNGLCGYATDYGRIAPLFMGVRSYAMPILSVELNPLHPEAGRGTLAATIRRLQRSLETSTRRHVWSAREQGVEERRFVSRRNTRHHISCQSADRSFPSELGLCDIIVTDPPYFDFIAYSDMSLFYRAWLWPDAEDGALQGKPIYPVGDDPVKDFGTRLGRAFAKASGSLKPGGLMTFTFHSTNPDAWSALSLALRKARLKVTAVFPVWADARAAAHGHPGNCEWDLVFTCRPADSGSFPEMTGSVEEWRRLLGDKAPSGDDLNSLQLGLEAAQNANREVAHEQGRADRGAEGKAHEGRAHGSDLDEGLVPRVSDLLGSH